MLRDCNVCALRKLNYIKGYLVRFFSLKETGVYRLDTGKGALEKAPASKQT